VAAIDEKKLVGRFFAYANKAWLRRTNCASLAEYLKYGRISGRHPRNYDFLFKSFTPYNGQPIKIGTTFCIKMLKDGYGDKLAALNREAVSVLEDRLSSKNISAGKCFLSQRVMKEHPLSFKDFFNDLIGYLGDYHFVTCISFNKDNKPFFLSQNGRNFDYEGINHLPKYNLTDSKNVLTSSEIPVGVYICD
jgi:hypothetical protein